MTSQKKAMKRIIVFIFAIFILFTALSGLMYLGVGNNSTQTGENLTGVSLETGTNLTGTNSTGKNLTGLRVN